MKSLKYCIILQIESQTAAYQHFALNNNTETETDLFRRSSCRMF